MLSFLRAVAARAARHDPCLLAVAGILCGALPLLAGWNLPYALLMCVPIPFLGAAALLLPLKDAVPKFALPLLLGAAFALFQVQQLEHDPLTSLCGWGPAGAEVRFRIDDSSCASHFLLPWMSAPPTIQCRTVAFRFSGSGEWRPLSAPFMLRCGDKVLPFFQPGFNDEYTAQGFFIRPDPPPVRGMFDYSGYLARRGILFQFRTSDPPLRLAEGRGFLRCVLNLRDSLLARVTASFRSDDARRLAAGLLFGFRQGADRLTKQNFIAGGVIHIFTVSGTHVGIFSAVLFLLLRGVPFRWRYLLVPVGTFGYVLSTGMGGPSLRAFTMLTVWALGKSFLYPAAPFNSLMLAAALLLLKNPFQCLDPGFQYSFLTVAALLACASFVRFWRQEFQPCIVWIPSGFISPLRRWQIGSFRFVFSLLASGAAAWLVSSSLALVYQGIFAAGGVVANLLLIPVAWLCYAAFACASCFAWISAPLTAFFARLLESMLGIMWTLGELFADTAWCLPHPPLWSALLVCAAVFVFLLTRRYWLSLTSFLLAVLSIAVWNYQAGFHPPELVVCSGGGLPPALVMTLPQSRSAVVVNVPDFESARLVTALLSGQGIRRCSHLLLTGGSADQCGGVCFLSPPLEIAEVLAPHASAYAKSLPETLSLLTSSGAHVVRPAAPYSLSGFQMASSGVTLQGNADFFQVQTCNPWPFLVLVFHKNVDGTGTLSVNGQNFPLKNTLQRQLFRLEIPEIRKKCL